MGSDPRFRMWVRLLYMEPLARMCSGGMLSKEWSVRRGMQQGCPLSLLFFPLAMELLAAKLQNEMRGFGMVVEEVTHLISLYGDDMFYLQCPMKSVPLLLAHLEDSGEVAGLHDNTQVTVAPSWDLMG
ncbi:hypothetical protein NDU88_009452 [Pleurodeles waltl]|uniref:Reverse transcriptase domain-containing protein n=1 Tax=Pleurodeles waltl TaxID=8319 RepID=A0AAV7RV98_PLEWA|nr:hypothetical protein NDU88_009452 [Pleurodeles waltl]